MIQTEVRRSFLIPILLVILTIVLAIVMTFAILKRQLRETAVKQSEIIANILNYGAENIYREDALQRLVSTLSGERNVEFILVLGNSPLQAVASSSRRWVGTRLDKLPFESTLIQSIEQSFDLKQTTYSLNQQDRYIDYLSPILLTRSIVRGQGTGLLPAITVIRLDLRDIYHRCLITSIISVVLIYSAVCITGLILFRLHRKRVITVVRSIIASAAQSEQENPAPRVSTVNFPEVRDLAAEFIRTYAALNQSEQRLRFSLRAGHIWACEVDLSIGAIVWNEDRGQLFNKTESAARPTLQDFYAIIHPDDRASVQAQLDRSIGNEEPFSSEFRTQNSMDGYHWIACRGKIAARQGYKSMILTGVDITQRKQYEATIALQQAKLIASSKLSALGEVAGGIAHEINNPLAILDGKLRQLKIFLGHEPAPRDSIASVMDSMACMIKRIAKIVRGLRTFSRNSESDPFERVKIKTVIDETLSLCKERFKAHDIQLLMDDNPPDMELECRATEISQVLLNLLSNSFDAVSQLDERWVKINCIGLHSGIEVSVMDSGSGIPEDVRSKLAQPFFTTKDVGKGTGLGLSISVGIVEAHNGSLHYDERSPNTRFVVYLPISQAKLQNIVENGQRH